MNGLQGSSAELKKIIAGARDLPPAIDLLVCPPATLIAGFAALARGSRVAIGAQDCHAAAAGAFTGDIAAEMLADAGASAVIVGHSERRSFHHETDAEIRAKALAAAGPASWPWSAWARPAPSARPAIPSRWSAASSRVRCPTARETSRSLTSRFGRSAAGLFPRPPTWRRFTTSFAGNWRGRYGTAAAAGMRILYGGSVKPSNAGELMGIENVDGALVGGASLKAEEFLAIAAVYR